MDSAANPLGGAQSLEDKFQGLHDSGAFEHKALEPKEEAPVAAAEEPQAPEPAEAEPEAPSYANLDEYLTKSGLERDSFYSLPVKVKIDGKESEVPFADVLKSYQLEGHVNQKSIALADKQREWEAAQDKQRQAIEQNLTRAKSLGDLAHKQLLAEYEGVDWNRLRAEDPQRWVIANQDFNNRAAQIQAHLAQVEEAAKAQAQEAQQKQLSILAKERERMLERHADWRDEKAFSAAKQQMTAYARDRGFSDAEIGAIFDHRYMDVLHDAAQWRAFQASAPDKLKQVRAAPKMAAPGARISRDPNQAAHKQAKDRFQKNPRDQDAAAAYFDRLAG